MPRYQLPNPDDFDDLLHNRNDEEQEIDSIEQPTFTGGAPTFSEPDDTGPLLHRHIPDDFKARLVEAVSTVQRSVGPVSRLGGRIVLEGYLNTLSFSPSGDAKVSLGIPYAGNADVSKLVGLYGYAFRVVIEDV